MFLVGPTLILRDVAPLLQAAKVLQRTSGDHTSDRPVKVKANSKKVEPGDLFIAYRGVSFDGHDAIPEAILRGAACIVVEDSGAVDRCGTLPVAVVSSGREAWAWLSAREHGDPQKDLTIVAVTGTNGKTSTVWNIRELLKGIGVPAVTIGTLGAYVGNEYHATTHTTPDPSELFALLAEAKQRRILIVAMEVSSHALEQHKLGPIQFQAAGFTSFSRDHLDLHGTMELYLDAKWRLFTNYLSASGVAYFNATVLPQLGSRALPPGSSAYGYSDEFATLDAGPARQLKVWVRAETTDGSEIVIEWPGAQERRGRIPRFGRHAVANFVLALAMAEFVAGNATPASAWMQIAPVPGRLQAVIATRRGAPAVFVDYAHTPDALEKTLELLQRVTLGTLWVVFGCGGERDPGKRPLMGAIAERLAHRVVVTTDNPRSEDPHVIIAGILSGMQRSARAAVIPDREAAIVHAVRSAQTGDVVLIAGKGHETYQIIGNDTRPFNDASVAQREL